MSDHTDVMEAIKDLARLATDLIIHDAIGLDKPLQMEGKRSIRIVAGDRVRVVGIVVPILLHVLPELPANAEVVECRGTIYSTNLQIDVRMLDTDQLLTVNL